MGFDVVCIGEPVAQLSPERGGGLRWSLASGAALAAVGFARLRRKGSTALVARFGGDAISDAMRDFLADEGVDCRFCRIAPQAVCALRAPGALRLGRTSARWRSEPPMRKLVSEASLDAVAKAIREAGLLYMTGDVLAALAEEERHALLSRASKTQFAFDAAYDPRDWPSRDDAALWIEAAYAKAQVILSTPRQEAALFGSAGGARDAAHAEIVMRNGAGPCLIARDGVWVEVAPGESLSGGGGATAFNVGYLSARLEERPVAVAAKAGHALAALAMRCGVMMPSPEAMAALSEHAEQL